MQPDSSPLSGDAWVLNDFACRLRTRKLTPPEVTARLPTESRAGDASPL
jgi:hypothetical protein